MQQNCNKKTVLNCFSCPDDRQGCGRLQVSQGEPYDGVEDQREGGAAPRVHLEEGGTGDCNRRQIFGNNQGLFIIL